MKLWEAAVREAGILDQDEVILALDHARIGQGPAARQKWRTASIMFA